MHELPRDLAVSTLGEGIHTSLRKAGESRESARAHNAIEAMDEDEWGRVLEFLLDGLNSMGIKIMSEDG